MITFIRHGEKRWANGKKPKYDNGYSHDPPLKKEAHKKIKLTKQKLLNQGNYPEKIITSPFLRCRQTAEILSGGTTPIVVNENLREYLGNWKKVPHLVNVSPTTQGHIYSPLIETYSEFRTRVLSSRKRVRSGTIWVVTHNLVISVLLNEKIDILQGDYITVDSKKFQSKDFSFN